MKSVLIIDDEPAILEMYQAKLEQEQFSVITATNGADGIKAAKEQKPSIILLDIIMPQVNGFDVLKALKEAPETKNIPVFITTNLPEHTSGEKAKELGAVNYLVKAEYEPGMVADVLKRYLENHAESKADTSAAKS